MKIHRFYASSFSFISPKLLSFVAPEDKRNILVETSSFYIVSDHSTHQQTHKCNHKAAYPCSMVGQTPHFTLGKIVKYFSRQNNITLHPTKKIPLCFTFRLIYTTHVNLHAAKTVKCSPTDKNHSLPFKASDLVPASHVSACCADDTTQYINTRTSNVRCRNGLSNKHYTVDI